MPKRKAASSAAPPAKRKKHSPAPAGKRKSSGAERPGNEEEIDSVNGYTFVVTGQFQRGRTAIEDLIRGKGGKVAASMTKSTHYLVNGSTGTHVGAKLKAAKKRKLPVLDEAWVLQHCTDMDSAEVSALALEIAAKKAQALKAAEEEKKRNKAWQVEKKELQKKKKEEVRAWHAREAMERDTLEPISVVDAWAQYLATTPDGPLAPPASPEELANLEKALGFPLPEELRELLALSNGGPVDGSRGALYGTTEDIRNLTPLETMEQRRFYRHFRMVCWPNREHSSFEMVNKDGLVFQWDLGEGDTEQIIAPSLAHYIARGFTRNPELEIPLSCTKEHAPFANQLKTMYGRAFGSHCKRERYG